MGIDISRNEHDIRNHYLAKIVSEAGQITVDVRTLDDICTPIRKRIRFIKIDTEGHELAVILGGMEILRIHKPTLCVEISTDLDDQRTDGARILHLLSEIGYACYTVHDGAMHVRVSGEKTINYFFVPSYLASALII